MPKRKSGQNKVESTSAVNEFFGDDAFEDTEDTPKPPRMKMAPNIYVPIPSPKKVDHHKDWENTGKVHDRFFKEKKPSAVQRQTTTTDDDEE